MKNEVTFEDGNYIISNENLGIIVWGETREDAEEAFNFAFVSMYNNYALEDDLKLTDKAIILKRKLLNLIDKEIINES